jgi:hypothetical protein
LEENAMKRPASVPTRLPELLHKRLNAYTLAASAAGVGALALTQSAEAKIIYTPKHVDCTVECPVNFVSHSGEASFFMAFGSSATSMGNGVEWLFVVGYQNGVVGNKTFKGEDLAAALPAGVPVRRANQMGNHEMWYSRHFTTGGKGISQALGLMTAKA